MVDDIIERISSESGVDEEDVRKRIKEKHEELSGLVSEEGAAHLVARDEGVELSEVSERDLKIKNVVPGMNRVEVKGKIVDITDTNTFEQDDGSEGRVRNLVLGDETGTIRMSLWNEQVDIAERVEKGETLHVRGAYTREDNRGNAELRIGEQTEMDTVDDDIEDVKVQSSGGHERVKVNEIMNEGRNYEVVGTLVQVYTDSPFYRACPECNKKVEESGDSWECGEHGEVEPQHNLIISAIIDDGHGNVRSVFFRDVAMDILGLDEDPEGDVDLVKERVEEILGREVEIRGRSRYNDFFDRIEIIGNEVKFLDERELIEERVEVLSDG